MKPFFLTKLEALAIASPILLFGLLAGIGIGLYLRRNWKAPRRKQADFRPTKRVPNGILDNS